ncbi:hypothetical protein [Helicovermis profundi]|uniref:Uncharacterized protein n=1 Tax=Helicovermis profundi TaxID=3065157 RepID=A0AAU9ETH1_9FIRM|nr:hypothetical protein HLPR_06860 [Clostridia bacterium S502]
MEKIKVKRLSFESYVETAGVMGLLLGSIYFIVGLLFFSLNLFGVHIAILDGELLKIVTAPFVYTLGGIMVSLITYPLYIVFMKFRKVISITYIK